MTAEHSLCVCVCVHVHMHTVVLFVSGRRTELYISMIQPCSSQRSIAKRPHGKRIILFPPSLPPSLPLAVPPSCSLFPPLPPPAVCACEWYPSVSCQCQGVIQRAVTSRQPALVRPFAAALPDLGPEKERECVCLF